MLEIRDIIYIRRLIVISESLVALRKHYEEEERIQKSRLIQAFRVLFKREPGEDEKFINLNGFPAIQEREFALFVGDDGRYRLARQCAECGRWTVSPNPFVELWEMGYLIKTWEPGSCESCKAGLREKFCHTGSQVAGLFAKQL